MHTSVSTGGFAAEAMLEAGSAPWQRVVLNTRENEHRTPAYLAINPAGQVPALQLPDGQVITESAAICIYLGDAHPETGLAPALASPARGAYLRWMLYLSSTVYSADLRCYYSARYTTDPAGADAVKACALDEMDRAFALMDDALEGHDWLAGDSMSAADIYLLMLTAWHPARDELTRRCKRLSAVCEKVKQADFVQRANDFHKLW
jgi:glutathione S-transferase